MDRGLGGLVAHCGRCGPPSVGLCPVADEPSAGWAGIAVRAYRTAFTPQSCRHQTTGRCRAVRATPAWRDSVCTLPGRPNRPLAARIRTSRGMAYPRLPDVCDRSVDAA